MSAKPLPVRLPLAVPTAMYDDASLDLDAQSAVAAAVAAAGADAVSVLDPVAGEAGLLDDDERAAVVRATRRGAGGLPVVAGIGPPGPGQLATAFRLHDAGADLLAVPLGAPASAPGGAAEHLGRIAELGVPLVLHHVPGVSGAARTAADLAALVTAVDASAVLYEAVPVPDAVAALVAAQVTVLGGLAGLFLPEELDAGAHGTAAATAVPEHVTGVVRRAATDVRDARELHLIACGYLRLEAGSAGTTVRKEAWRQRGTLSSGRVRQGRPLGAATKAAISTRLGELGVELAAAWPRG